MQTDRQTVRSTETNRDGKPEKVRDRDRDRGTEINRDTKQDKLRRSWLKQVYAQTI